MWGVSLRCEASWRPAAPWRLGDVFREAAPRHPLAISTGNAELESILEAWLARLAGEPTAGPSFIAHVARLTHAEAPELLTDLPIEDLHLAFSCSVGDPRAMARLEKLYFDEIAVAHRKYGSADRQLDDLKQMIRVKLFVADDSGRPRIGTFSGRGSLRGWLRVLIARSVIEIARRRTYEVALDDDRMLDIPDQAESVELARTRKTYRDAMKVAFDEAVEELSIRQRNMLRYAFADRLSIDKIGAIYGVHRSTASRWVEDARAALASRLRQGLMAKLDLEDAELASVLRLALSRIDLTISRYLRHPRARET
jgi:RNA polymerase sigma-70 factor (ECF subfamily)